MSKTKAHYVLSTHWDREWWLAFQDFRFYLVQLMDRVIAGFDDGSLKGPFHLDGQAILAEDYLEIRPERRDRLIELIKEGKIEIGPWYVLPDEFAVSGESLIRNLKMGHEVSLSLGGEPSTAGYLCDMFGHNSQMPQIFASFGIRGAFLFRGINTVNKRNYIWRGADGTEIPIYRFGPIGYGSYAVLVRRADEFKTKIAPEAMAKDLRELIQKEIECSDVDSVLLFDGCDHQEWDQQAYKVILQQIENSDAQTRIVHTRLDEYLAGMILQIKRIENRLEGELREPGRYPITQGGQTVISGVLSSRVGIKQANNECQTLLCNWAEPFSAFAAATLGQEYPDGFLKVAWRWLLKNHPHDSICGCSIDQVHKDMVYRFDQCRLIADRITTESTKRLAASIKGEIGDYERRVVVFNPLGRDFCGVKELELEIPSNWPTFNEFVGYEPKPALRIYNNQGEEIGYQRLGQGAKRNKTRKRDAKFPEGYTVRPVRVALKLSVPAFGYTGLILRPDAGQSTAQAGKTGSGIAGQQANEGMPTRHPEVPGLATSERSMENEILSVVIESNGTVSMTDKRTGEMYSRLLTFEDCADIGDGWYHGVAVNDQRFVSTGCKTDVALVHNGPLLTTFRVRTKMEIPERFCFDTITRSDKFAEMVIDSYVSLRAGQEFFDVRTVVDNPVEDHRIRVLLPSGANAKTYLADSPFDVVERPIALREDNYLYQELEVDTKPQQSWTAVFDKKRGLAVVGAGLLESAVVDLAERPIALTLFRGTRRTFGTDGEPGGQCNGIMTFNYRVFPLKGEPNRAILCEQGQQLSAGMRVVHLSQEDIEIYRVEREVPRSCSFLSVEGQAVVSSVRQEGDGLAVRLFNPNDIEINSKLHIDSDSQFGKSISKAQYVDFRNEPTSEAFEIDNDFSIKLKAKQIVTIRFS